MSQTETRRRLRQQVLALCCDEMAAGLRQYAKALEIARDCIREGYRDGQKTARGDWKNNEKN